MTLVNDHVLFPHAADWSKPPTSSRNWQTVISEALPGQEVRQAMRSACRRTLNFSITPQTIEERIRLDARWDAAAKSGLASVPFFGRSCQLTAGALDTEFTIETDSSAWTWAVGDYVLLMNGDQMFDAHRIDSISGAVLTLETALDNYWPTGSQVWPLFFGKFTAQKSPAFTSWHESVGIEVMQTVSERSAQLGAVIPPVGDGVGIWAIGTTFEPA